MREKADRLTANHANDAKGFVSIVRTDTCLLGNAHGYVPIAIADKGESGFVGKRRGSEPLAGEFVVSANAGLVGLDGVDG